MSAIDVNTGLPELPEHHFWRIGEESIQIRVSRPDTEWFEPKYSGHVSYNPNREQRWVPKTETRKVFGFIPITWTREAFEVRYTNISEEVVRVETGSEIVPAEVQGLCNRAMQKFEMLSLYGDYPPKKFERKTQDG